MDIRKIKKLIDLVEDSGIAEIEIHEGEESVRISRYNPHPAPVTYAAPQPYMPAMPAPAILEATPAASAKAAPADNHAKAVKSPMVGTFYRSPSPASKPFVEEGQKIHDGDTLCIIEAMKILNQITSDRTGTLTKILVENGSPVEFDQPLFIIE